MHPKKNHIQSFILWTRKFPGVNRLYLCFYQVASPFFCLLCMLAQFFSCAFLVRTIYLRRGGGRGDLLPGASDLDFFLVLSEVDPRKEVRFLHAFWFLYGWLKFAFPFLGEVLMGSEPELAEWLRERTARSQEAVFSFQRIFGRPVVEKYFVYQPAILNDLYSEALKCYSALLEATLKTPDLHQGLMPHDSSAVALRHAAKAAVDLFRFRALASLGSWREQEPFWSASRTDLAEKLFETYFDQALVKDLRSLTPLLLLEGKLFCEHPLDLFARITRQSLIALDQIAALLEKEQAPSLRRRKKTMHNSVPNSWCGTLQELVAERIFQRNQDLILGAETDPAWALSFFSMAHIPDENRFRAFLSELSSVSHGLEGVGILLPLTELSRQQMKSTIFFDEFLHAHRPLIIMGTVSTCTIEPPPFVLRKAYLELAFRQRFEPHNLHYLLNFHLKNTLELKLLLDHRETVPLWQDCLERSSALRPREARGLEAMLLKMLGEIPASIEVEFVQKSPPQRKLKTFWLQMFPLMREVLLSTQTPGKKKVTFSQPLENIPLET